MLVELAPGESQPAAPHEIIASIAHGISEVAEMRQETLYRKAALGIRLTEEDHGDCRLPSDRPTVTRLVHAVLEAASNNQDRAYGGEIIGRVMETTPYGPNAIAAVIPSMEDEGLITQHAPPKPKPGLVLTEAGQDLLEQLDVSVYIEALSFVLRAQYFKVSLGKLLKSRLWPE